MAPDPFDPDVSTLVNWICDHEQPDFVAAKVKVIVEVVGEAPMALHAEMLLNVPSLSLVVPTCAQVKPLPVTLVGSSVGETSSEQAKKASTKLFAAGVVVPVLL